MPQVDDEDFFDCYGCGETYHMDERCRSDYDGEWRCDGCHDEHLDSRHYEEERYEDESGVYDYSYRPDPHFYSFHDPSGPFASSRWSPRPILNADGYRFEEGFKSQFQLPSKLYIGMELETESCSDKYRKGAELVYEKWGEDFVYLKHDGSLSHGFEIVTHPATEQYYSKQVDWEAISGLSNLGFKAWNRRSCGLHLHLSRSAFLGHKHLFKFFYLIYKNSHQMIQFAGRQSGFASFEIGHFLNRIHDWDANDVGGVTFMDMAKSKSSNMNRYCAVNLRNRNTIELRFFRPSLRPDTVIAAIQMADALYNYTATLPTVDVMQKNALSFAAFKSWVNDSKQLERYGVLAQRIDERVLHI